MESWQVENRIISDLQGACHEGFLCSHTHFILKGDAVSMESNRNCFFVFFDVAKAFDTVWINGLFKQIYDLGITGITWRLSYRCLQNCHVLDWYSLFCGIHQEGYMS